MYCGMVGGFGCFYVLFLCGCTAAAVGVVRGGVLRAGRAACEVLRAAIFCLSGLGGSCVLLYGSTAAAVVAGEGLR
jgi:hypothetical protein